MTHYLNIRLLIFIGALSLVTSCDKTEVVIPETKQYQVPSIEKARQYFNDHSDIQTVASNMGLRTSEDGALNIDWEKSQPKTYKEEPQTTVDILYTPIYLPTSGDAKSFVGTVELNGDVQSKIFVLLYTEGTIKTAFSGMMLIYDLDGQIEYAFEYVDGQKVAEGLPNLMGSSLNRTAENGDNCDFPLDSLGCLLDWIGGDWFGVAGYLENDVVEVIAVGDSSTGGTVSDTAWENQSIAIPYLGDDFYSTGSLDPWWNSNTVSAEPLSIIVALELANVTVPEAQWLLNEASLEQLQNIANFLNAQRVLDKDTTPSDFENSGVDQSQAPEISQEALDFALSMLYYLMNHPGTTLEFDTSNVSNNITPDFGSFSELEDYYSNTSFSSSIDQSIDYDKFDFNFNMPLFGYTINLDITKNIPDGNSCDCIEIVEANSYISGNETITSYSQIGEYWTEVNSSENSITVKVRGKIRTGVKVFGFPWYKSDIYIFYVKYNHSNGTVMDYGFEID